ncbi:MAG: hypothetical protein WCL57_19520 [Chloroflexota bacterium]
MLTTLGQIEAKDLFHIISVDWIKTQFQTTLDPDTASVIHKIVLRNVLCGRVARLFAHRQQPLTEDTIANYVGDVIYFYKVEKAQWRLLRTKEGHELLQKLLKLYAGGHVKKLRGYGFNITREEAINESFVHANQYLQQYPFDVRLEKWLDYRGFDCAYKLCQENNQLLVQVALEQIEDLYVNDFELNYRSEQITLENRLIVENHQQHLSRFDQHIWAFWRSGYSIKETASRLCVPSHTVSNRRHHIRAFFRRQAAM